MAWCGELSAAREEGEVIHPGLFTYQRFRCISKIDIPKTSYRLPLSSIHHIRIEGGSGLINHSVSSAYMPSSWDRHVKRDVQSAFLGTSHVDARFQACDVPDSRRMEILRCSSSKEYVSCHLSVVGGSAGRWVGWVGWVDGCHKRPAFRP